jgi:hypothetical protein
LALQVALTKLPEFLQLLLHFFVLFKALKVYNGVLSKNHLHPSLPLNNLSRVLNTTPDALDLDLPLVLKHEVQLVSWVVSVELFLQQLQSALALRSECGRDETLELTDEVVHPMFFLFFLGRSEQVDPSNLFLNGL